MWILKWLPFWIFYAILVIGLIGLAVTYLLKFIPVPAIYIYKTPIQLGSVALIVLGTYMSGAISNEEAWLARVKELEAKVEAAQIESTKENVKIETKIVTKTQVIKERGEEIIKYVDKEIVKFDTKFLPGGECEIPKEFIITHNKAAEVPK
jgi:nucleotide-binding universal stress UspA family protein